MPEINITNEFELEEGTKNFTDWFFSSNQFQEKFLSFIVLFVEIFILFNHSLGIQTNKITMAFLFNFFFLIYFILSFRKHYKHGFSITDASKIKQINNFEGGDSIVLDIYEKRANQSIGQFRQFSGFLIATAILYILLMAKEGEEYFYSCPNYKDYFVRLHSFIQYSLNLAIVFTSYAGALYILKCFYIMYFPTFKDDNISPTLDDKTNLGWLLILFMVVVEAFYTFPLNCLANDIDIARTTFLFETICSLVNAIALILLCARFELRMLGINPAITFILYLYALCQTTLPLVNGTASFFCTDPKNFDDSTKESIITLILSLCLLGKIVFYNIVVYLYKTKRFFYYFIITTLNYRKESDYWDQFRENVKENINLD